MKVVLLATVRHYDACKNGGRGGGAEDRDIKRQTL